MADDKVNSKGRIYLFVGWDLVDAPGLAGSNDPYGDYRPHVYPGSSGNWHERRFKHVNRLKPRLEGGPEPYIQFWYHKDCLGDEDADEAVRRLGVERDARARFHNRFEEAGEEAAVQEFKAAMRGRRAWKTKTVKWSALDAHWRGQ